MEGTLHEALRQDITHRLDHLRELEEAGDTEELCEIRANAPKAIPRPHMRTLWEPAHFAASGGGRRRIAIFLAGFRDSSETDSQPPCGLSCVRS